FLRLFENETRDRRVVIDRVGIRHATDRGESASHSRARSRFDGLLVFEARLAQMHMQVNEARSNDQSRGVKSFNTICPDIFVNHCDFAVLNQEITASFKSLRGVNDCAVANQQSRHNLNSRLIAVFRSVYGSGDFRGEYETNENNETNGNKTTFPFV